MKNNSKELNKNGNALQHVGLFGSPFVCIYASRPVLLERTTGLFFVLVGAAIGLFLLQLFLLLKLPAWSLSLILGGFGVCIFIGYGIAAIRMRRRFLVAQKYLDDVRQNESMAEEASRRYLRAMLRFRCWPWFWDDDIPFEISGWQGPPLVVFDMNFSDNFVCGDPGQPFLQSNVEEMEQKEYSRLLFLAGIICITLVGIALAYGGAWAGAITAVAWILLMVALNNLVSSFSKIWMRFVPTKTLTATLGQVSVAKSRFLQIFTKTDSVIVVRPLYRRSGLVRSVILSLVGPETVHHERLSIDSPILAEVLCRWMHGYVWSEPDGGAQQTGEYMQE